MSQTLKGLKTGTNRGVDFNCRCSQLHLVKLSILVTWGSDASLDSAFGVYWRHWNNHRRAVPTRVISKKESKAEHGNCGAMADARKSSGSISKFLDCRYLIVYGGGGSLGAPWKWIVGICWVARRGFSWGVPVIPPVA
jgi:hypothetical protein